MNVTSAKQPFFISEALFKQKPDTVLASFDRGINRHNRKIDTQKLDQTKKMTLLDHENITKKFVNDILKLITDKPECRAAGIKWIKDFEKVLIENKMLCLAEFTKKNLAVFHFHHADRKSEDFQNSMGIVYADPNLSPWFC